jgi:3-hydroxyacyl-CoA dehydrogenase
MFKPFRTAAVLGAGVMGTQIAAHLANAGLTVHLLDISASGTHKNQIVETAFQKALKQTPAVFFTDKTARRITLGNFEEHLHRISDVDWVIEAVIEKLSIKQQLMEQVESLVRDDAVISTNTSGLSIHDIVLGRSESFRRRFLGTHFFNPPRYLKLLELIPTDDTDPLILERLQWFGQLHLGKGMVVAKDTPNFIANRIGLYMTMLGLRAVMEGHTERYTIEEIDILTGTLVGRPKSGTFRTADLVGLDTLLYVTDNLYPAIPHDESREIFRMPDWVRKLVEIGTLGAKTGQGFYKKEKQQILSLNLKTFVYESAQPMTLDVEAIAKLPNLGDRLRALYQDTGRAGAFFRRSTLSLLNYSAHRIPEISDRPADIDQAMRWGFGWELGPFEIWDALGFIPVLTAMNASGMTVPHWINTMQQAGITQFYQDYQVYEPQEYQPLRVPDDAINLTSLKANPQRTIWQNAEAALLDLGDRVALYEFRSKGNTLGMKVLDGLSDAMDLLEAEDWRGLVIGNASEHFSGGANLAEMGILAQEGRFDAFASLISQFQQLMQRIHYFPKPIVAAVRGRALGGGCELIMACPQVVAAAESYIGLVELGVGLIPGGCGLMRSVALTAERAATEAPHHIQPFLINAFETIATAKVSTSAHEAQAWGYLPATARIIMNGDRRLEVAKEEVIRMEREGYVPPPKRTAIMVLGRPARAVLELAAYTFQQGGFASEYDRYLANRLAYVMTGGDLSAPALVDEDYLLQLERENFVPLLSQPQTQERIAHMLKTKKPLRN